MFEVFVFCFNILYESLRSLFLGPFKICRRQRFTDAKELQEKIRNGFKIIQVMPGIFQQRRDSTAKPAIACVDDFNPP